MKYCPYCGATLMGSAASFCAECGKSLTPAAKPKQRPKPKKSVKKQPPPSRRPKPDPRDEGYDGYYNDVKPIDNGHTRDRMDSELVKRIIILSVGAFIIVMFAVMLMYLL